MDIKSFNKSILNITLPVKWYIFLVSIFIVLILLVIIFNKNFYDYYEGYAKVVKNNDDTNLKLSIPYTDLEKISKNKYIKINDEISAYKIINIDEEDYVSKDSFYKVVNISLDSCDLLNDLYVNYKIIMGKETLLNYFLKTLKGG